MTSTTDTERWGRMRVVVPLIAIAVLLAYIGLTMRAANSRADEAKTVAVNTLHFDEDAKVAETCRDKIRDTFLAHIAELASAPRPVDPALIQHIADDHLALDAMNETCPYPDPPPER